MCTLYSISILPEEILLKLFNFIYSDKIVDIKKNKLNNKILCNILEVNKEIYTLYNPIICNLVDLSKLNKKFDKRYNSYVIEFYKNINIYVTIPKNGKILKIFTNLYRYLLTKRELIHINPYILKQILRLCDTYEGYVSHNILPDNLEKKKLIIDKLRNYCFTFL